MKILYTNKNDIKQFDIDKFKKSLCEYDNSITTDKIEQAMVGLNYDPMHASVLVEVGIKLIRDDKKAEQYYNDHKRWFNMYTFERLARITGYLVGSLERWNDGKLAEYHERVKHNIDDQYTPEAKAELEKKHQEDILTRQV